MYRLPYSPRLHHPTYFKESPYPRRMKSIEHKIYLIRGQRVMLDSDLAQVYGVTTKNLIKAVKRNQEKFPDDFIFQINAAEYQNLRFQFGTSRLQHTDNQHGGRRYLPYVFTEHGAVMLATVLNSPIAVKASILAVKAFVKLTEVLSQHKELAKKIAALESKTDKHDKEIQTLLAAIRQLIAPPEQPRRKIGYR